MSCYKYSTWLLWYPQKTCVSYLGAWLLKSQGPGNNGFLWLLWCLVTMAPMHMATTVSMVTMVPGTRLPSNYTANYRVNGGPVIMLVYTEPPSCAVKYRPPTLHPIPVDKRFYKYPLSPLIPLFLCHFTRTMIPNITLLGDDSLPVWWGVLTGDSCPQLERFSSLGDRSLGVNETTTCYTAPDTSCSVLPRCEPSSGICPS